MSGFRIQSFGEFRTRFDKFNGAATFFAAPVRILRRPAPASQAREPDSPSGN
jgi:hypothetical protein